MAQPTLKLQQLHDHFAELVNLAVAEDRHDLVQELAAEFTDAATRIQRGVAPPALPDVP